MTEHRFSSQVWEHSPGDPGSWHFLTVPAEVCEELSLESGPPGGFGSIRVQARIGGTTWSTSLFPESGGDGAMVLPVKKQVHERLYGGSHLLNDRGQYLYYGRVGGCLITGNEDGVKHCAQNVLYTLQHIGYTIPPQADAGWIGEAGPGPSYLDPGSGGPENDFTNRNTTFMTWNLMHLARLLKDAGGVPAYGNQRSEWDAGCRFDFANPEYR